MKKLFSLFLATAFVLSALSGCSGSEKKDESALSAGSSSGTTDKLDTIKAKGELVVYTDPNFPPFEYAGNDGKYVGADIDLAQAIADELNVKLVVKSADFDSVIMAIAGGSGDLAISGMTIREDRAENADFSNRYFKSIQYLIVPKNSAIKVMEDLKGKKIGVAAGYTGSLLIDDEINTDEGVLKGSGASFKECLGAAEAVLELQSGKVDAVVMDKYVAEAVTAGKDGLTTFELKYASGPIPDEYYGVVVPKNNPLLLAEVNKVVDRLVSGGKIEEWVVNHATTAK